MRLSNFLIGVLFVYFLNSFNSASAQPFPILFDSPTEVNQWIQFANNGDVPENFQFSFNPDKTGINNSDYCLYYNVLMEADPWVGTFSDAYSPIIFTKAQHKIEVMVYKDVISKCIFKVEGPYGDFEYEVHNTKINEWETLSFDFSAEIGIPFTRLVFFPDFPDVRVAGSKCYIDNIDLNETTQSGFSDYGLLAYYPFNQGAIDVSGNENHGMPINVLESPDRLGIDPSAVEFSGINSYIEFDHDKSESLCPKDEFTISCFLKNLNDGDASNGNILLSTGNSGLDISLSGTNNSVMVLLSTNNEYKIISTGPDALSNTWKHFAVTWDRQRLKIYIDGVIQADEECIADFINYSTHSYLLGRYDNDDTYSYVGYLDNLRIYARALSQSQIITLMQQEAFQILIDTVYKMPERNYLPQTNDLFKFIRYESYYSEDDGQVNIHEIECYSEGINVALMKPVEATSTQNSAYLKENAVDGTTDRWSSDRNTYHPDSLNPQYLSINLGDTYSLDSMIIDIGYWNQTFAVYASPDSINWYQIAAERDTTGTFNFISSVEKIVSVYDTIEIEVFDSIFIDVFDTTYVEVFDTTYVEVFDSIAVTDTLIIDAVISALAPPDNIGTIKVYPNPAKDLLFISTMDYMNMDGYLLKIVNQLGVVVYETVFNQSLYEVNLSNWTGYGLYYLQIIDPESKIIETRKIILTK